MPEGKLICSHSGNSCKWYISDGHKKTYIPRVNRSLAEKLAEKKLYLLELKDLENEKTALEFYLNHRQINKNKLEELLSDSTGYGELLAPYFKPLSKELEDWANAPFETNLKHPEHLIHRTGSGHLVRSKSEALIATCLYKNKIPFRYECALQLGELTIFPDFTIRHPESGKIFYWEHNGMLHDSSYVKNYCNKLQLYISNGIVPTIQLITTYETKDTPLSSYTIENLINNYFIKN